MKSPRQAQSALKTPLNSILGTEANVRLLRALSLSDTPVASGELARRARLGRTSIYPALSALESEGIIEFVGAGAQRQARFRHEHPLAPALLELFAAEERRVDAFITALRAAVKTTSPQPTAAWLEGVDDEFSSTSDTLTLYVLGDPQTLSEIVDELSERATPIESTSGVHLDIRSLTRSELEVRAKKDALRLKESVLLGGVPPTGLMAASEDLPNELRLRSHNQHDVRARRLAVAIAAKLKLDPGLVRLARKQVAQRTTDASPREQRELKEWSRLLTTMSHARLQRFLVEDSERAKRLRQSLPGLGLLTAPEREAVLKSRTDDEARAVVSHK